MIKKFIYVIICFLLSIFVVDVRAEEISDETIKKVVSIVYDDSGSMNNDNEDWAYASYSIQNLIGLLNSQDELNVVKMSNPVNNINFNLLSSDIRKNNIRNTYNWTAKGKTPFKTVDTAVNWLKSKKNEYGDSQTVEYWLVIITDGAFGYGYPSNMNKYLSDLKSAMGNSKYEGIFVAIGNDVPDYSKKDFMSVSGNHLITAKNSGDIVNAMFEVSGLILGQGGNKIDLNIKNDLNNQITFESYFPLRKFIIYEQNQNVSINNILVNESSVKVVDDFNTENPGSEIIKSRILHCESNKKDFIPAGKVSVNFSNEIDITDDKFKILIEPALSVKLNIIDDNGQIIKDLDSVSFVEGDLVRISAMVVSSIDGSEIDLRNWNKELISELIVGNEKVSIEYNSKDNTFYGNYKIKVGSNLMYAVVNLPGYFRTKSDVRLINAKQIVDEIDVILSNSELDVLYKYTDDYEEIGTFIYKVSGEKISGVFDFLFKGIPKGITVSVNGKYVDNDGLVSIQIDTDVPVEIKFYRNRDYSEEEKSKILIDVSSKDYELKWKDGSITEVILNPVKRKITLETVKIDENNSFKLDEFDNKDIYVVSVLGNNEYLTKNELETLIIKHDEIKGIVLDKEVISYNGRYALKIICKKNKMDLFVETGKISSNMVISTIYNEKTDKIGISFEIIDNFIKYILPLIIFLIIVLLIGYLPGIKKRIDTKRYCIKVNDEYEMIKVKLLSRLIPYVSEKAIGSDLTLIATANKNRVMVMNNFDTDAKIMVNGYEINNSLKIDLFLDDELKISELNRDTIYSYCKNMMDEVVIDNMLDIGDMDDIFEGYKNINDDYLDSEFFR